MLTGPEHDRWSFRLSAGFGPRTRRRRQIDGGTCATKREAKTERNKAAAKIDSGKVPTVDRTYADYLMKWF